MKVLPALLVCPACLAGQFHARIVEIRDLVCLFVLNDQIEQ